MRNIKTAVTIVVVLILLLSLSGVVVIVHANPVIPTMTGDFQHDNDNDSPIFIEWYDAQSIINPLTDVVFFVIIQDIDNASDELIVDLYYSEYEFRIQNFSQSMSFISVVSVNTYRYEYLMSGKPEGTYMDYYFQVNDSSNVVRKPLIPATETFSIQWLYHEVVTILQPVGDEPVAEVPLVESGFIAVFFILLVPALFLFLAFTNTKKTKN